MGCEWGVNGDLNPHGMCQRGLPALAGIGYRIIAMIIAAVRIPDAGSPAAGNTVRA